jgi:putative transcriptional regulator
MPDLPISNCIRELRAAHNDMTQLELSRKIGMSRQTINTIELGKYSPSLEVAFRIAQVFDKPLEAVFQYQQ